MWQDLYFHPPRCLFWSYCCDSGSGFSYLRFKLLSETSMWFPLVCFSLWSHSTLAHNSQEGIALLNPLSNSPLFKEENPDSPACHLELSPSFPQLVFLLATYLFILFEPVIFLTLLSLDIFVLSSRCMPTFPRRPVKIISDDDQNKSIYQKTL